MFNDKDCSSFLKPSACMLMIECSLHHIRASLRYLCAQGQAAAPQLGMVGKLVWHSGAGCTQLQSRQCHTNERSWRVWMTVQCRPAQQPCARETKAWRKCRHQRACIVRAKLKGELPICLQ